MWSNLTKTASNRKLGLRSEQERSPTCCLSNKCLHFGDPHLTGRWTCCLQSCTEDHASAITSTTDKDLASHPSTGTSLNTKMLREAKDSRIRKETSKPKKETAWGWGHDEHTKQRSSQVTGLSTSELPKLHNYFSTTSESQETRIVRLQRNKVMDEFHTSH